jgi:hypothetical protein
MKFVRRPLAVFASLAALTLLACGGTDGGSASGQPSPDAGPAKPDTAPDSASAPASPDPSEPANATEDPIPAAIPPLAAFGNRVDQPIDLSCVGNAFPANGTAATDREFHAVELGADDSARVANAKIELFYDNQLKPPADVTITSPDGDATTKGLFHATVAPGWIAYRVVAPLEGYLPIYALDLEVPATGPVLPAIPAAGTVEILSALIGPSGYVATKGAGRAVVRVVDCKYNQVQNAHVTIVVDGKSQSPKKAAGSILRGYFTDAEFPGTAAWTSRSGVVAFLEIPGTAKTIKVVARGMIDGVERVIAVRTIPLLVDGVTTAKMFPYVTTLEK